MISMPEVYVFSYAAALSRGFPEPACDEIASRVVWLESRGLPGLIALTREFLNNHKTDLAERGMQCPIIAGATLHEQFDDLVSKEPGKPNVIHGPTNGVLLLPAVARFAEKIGQPVRVSWLMSEPPEIMAQTVVGAGKVASYGEPEALLFNTGVGFALHGEDMEDGQGPDLAFSEIPRQVFDPLLGFIGRERAEVAIKVHSILSSDAETLKLLHMMSDGDRSILASAPQVEPGTPVALTTSPGSSNDKLWARLGQYGWTEPTHDDTMSEELRALTSLHLLTQAGRAAMPLLVYALDRLRPTVQ